MLNATVQAEPSAERRLFGSITFRNNRRLLIPVCSPSLVGLWGFHLLFLAPEPPMSSKAQERRRLSLLSTPLQDSNFRGAVRRWLL
jgi:hypothetical protein